MKRAIIFATVLALLIGFSSQAFATVPGTPGTPTASVFLTNGSGFTATWSGASNSPTSYVINVGTTSGGGQIMNNINIGNVTTYAIGGLSPGTTYYVKVYGVNSSGNGSFSGVLTATTIPAPPVIGATTLVTTTGFTINWTASTGATSYYLDISTDGFLTFVSGYHLLSVSGTTNTVTGLSPNGYYFYRLWAVNSNGTSSLASSSAQGTYTTIPTTNNATSITTSGFTANWNASTGASAYSLDVCSTSTCSSIVPGFSGLNVGGGTSYAVTGLSSGTNYWYRIHSVTNSTGTYTPGSFNTPTSVWTIPATPAISSPVIVGSSSFTATWIASTGATYYELNVATDPLFASIVYTNNNISGTSYTVTGLTQGTNYYYQVIACDSSGCSASSGTQFTDFTPPTVVGITAGTSSSDASPVDLTIPGSLGGPYVRTTTPFITLKFSEPVTGIQLAYNSSPDIKLTLSTSTTALQLASGYVPGSATTPTAAGSPSPSTFQPNSALTNGATYKVTITGGGSVSTGIRDLSGGSSGSSTGNPLLSPPVYSFTVDTTAPTVNTATSTPANGATGISPTTNIVINFTENLVMNYNTYAAIGNVVLTDSSGNTVTCTVSWGANPYKTLTVTPADTLGYNTTYTLTLSNIADAAGNPLGTYTTSFTTIAASEATYSIVPPFVASSVVPNVLIVLDNSNSMDEDLQGNAIGSFNCTDATNPNSCSRSVLERQTLINLINTFGNKMNIGLMSYNLPAVSHYQLYNNFYFTSYDQRTYCPNPPQACQAYCTGEDPQPSNLIPTSTYLGITGNYTPSANEAACLNACQAQNLHFQSNIRDPITTTNGMGGSSGTGGSSYGTPIGSAFRTSYCGLVYPKTGVYTDTTQTPSTNVYHGVPGTLYDTSSTDGIQYLFAGKPAQGSGTYYNSTNSASNTYYYYKNKVGQTDGFTGYSNYDGSGTFVPTDDDMALGFYNYGQTNMWYPPYNGAAAPTWFVDSAANPASGFLHVPIAANNSSNTQVTALLNMLGPQGWMNNPNGYTTCTTGSGNTCDHIINAGVTPTAGTMQSVIDYFNGNLAASLTQTNTAQASPIQYRCQKNYVIFVTDGLPSVDQNGNSKDSSGNLYTAAALIPAVQAKLQQLSCPTAPSGALNCTNQYTKSTCSVCVNVGSTPYVFDVKTYVLGLAMTSQSATLLDQMAQSGETANPVNLNGVNDGGQHAYYANNATSLNNALVNIFQNILQDASSGTAASILNNSQGSGANLLQAVFYPVKPFDNSTKASWTGEVQALWYYLDPYFNTSTIREDTNQDYVLELNQDNIVNFRFNTTTAQTVVDLYQDVLGNDKQLVSQGTGLSFDTPKSLWKLGKELWQRNITDSNTSATYDPRNIYTVLSSVPSSPDPNIVSGISPSTIALQKFSSVDSDNFNSNTTAQQYLQVGSKTAANTLINYISGIDDPSGTYRGRKVTMLNCGLSDAEGCTREWRLGDIIGSTPKLVTNNSLNSYSLMPPYGYSDTSYAQFTASTNYTNRGVAFVGGNDGMLHAVRLGILDVSQQTSTNSSGTAYIDPLKKARMMYPAGSLASYSTSNLGREEWAFIPMNALPYLGYLGNSNYSHMYYVDDTVTVFDASINVPGDNNSAAFPNCAAATYQNCQKQTEYGTGTSSNPLPLNMPNTSWRTVLIGGMGLGGATRNYNTTTCVDGVQSGTCVKTPLNGIGYSSYFALDVTNPATLPNSSDPNAVKFLWEFNGNGQLGYSLSGPAIVRIGPPSMNGKWYAVFGSGPTGPIDTTAHTFYGSSDQDLKLFVVDIGTGTLVATLDTGIPNAFAGTVASSVIDVDRNSQTLPGFYTDDAIYVGYVKKDPSAGTWTKGGVLRVLTKGNQDPTQWSYTTPLIDNTGPVTTSIAKLQDRTAKYKSSSGTTGSATGKLWIYFGTGRYFYNTDMSSVSTPFELYGVKDPCYSENTGDTGYLPTGPSNAFDTSCTASVDATKLANQTGTASAAPASSLADSYPGWYISLSLSETVNGSTYNSERVITNPVASGSGAVFFTTFSPAADVCGYGGESQLWAVNYATGAAPPAAAVQGSALMQSSTGALTQISLSTAFSNPTNLGYNNRRLAQPITGVPPLGNGLALMSNPKPTKKILHYQEK